MCWLFVVICQRRKPTQRLPLGHVRDGHVKDAAQDVAEDVTQDLAEDVLGAASSVLFPSHLSAAEI